MDHPLYTVALVIMYLAWILVLGPLYMQNRKPFQLKRTLIVYNALQVALSAYMFYEHLMAGWLNYYNLKCQPVDYSDGPMSKRTHNGYNPLKSDSKINSGICPQVILNCKHMT
uniref:Elongation of very long chain fatty acids protein n=1 Tax=Glossina morsitans morsitans TaxID=37546 RepID=A0A1B0G5I4_GLOMM